MRSETPWGRHPKPSTFPLAHVEIITQTSTFSLSHVKMTAQTLCIIIYSWFDTCVEFFVVEKMHRDQGAEHVCGALLPRDFTPIPDSFERYLDSFFNLNDILY